jgi:hypothetical protein
MFSGKRASAAQIGMTGPLGDQSRMALLQGYVPERAVPVRLVVPTEVTDGVPILVACALDSDLWNFLNMGVMLLGKRAFAAQIGMNRPMSSSCAISWS